MQIAGKHFNPTLTPINGLKQAVMLFWQKVLEIMKKMGNEQSLANSCRYFTKNKTGELAVWSSWVDDNQIIGLLQGLKVEGEQLAKQFKIEVVGKLNVSLLGAKLN